MRGRQKSHGRLKMASESTEGTGQHASVWPHSPGHVKWTPPFSRLFARRWTMVAGQLVSSRLNDESGLHSIRLNENLHCAQPTGWLAKQNIMLNGCIEILLHTILHLGGSCSSFLKNGRIDNIVGVGGFFAEQQSGYIHKNIISTKEFLIDYH